MRFISFVRWAAALGAALVAGWGAAGARAGEATGLPLSYTAAPGESNHVTLTTDGANWILTDVVPIHVQEEVGCSQPTPTSVSCPVQPGSNEGPYIDLSAGHDTSFTYAASTDPRGQGVDVILGSGTNSATGGPGDDRISGDPHEPGNDTIRGMGGNDQLVGNGGTDTLDGGPGNDRLDASAGTGDTLIGGPGKDELDAGTGDHIMARDGVGAELIDCTGPAAQLEYDAASTLDARGASEELVDGTVGDDVEGIASYHSACFGAHDTGSGTLTPTRRRLRFALTPRTMSLRVPFACSRTAIFGCSGSAELAIESGIYSAVYQAQPFFILPGQRLTVPLRTASRADARFAVTLLRRGVKPRFSWRYLPKTPIASAPDREVTRTRRVHVTVRRRAR